uniref:VWFA domain-containing protein n=1 Tax=Caenorhabditis japonica TaxID=281687 RepID=A0A8R1HS00_CAEJA
MLTFIGDALAGPLRARRGSASGQLTMLSTTSPFITSDPGKQNAYCDASANLLTNIFLVDVSDPIIGTIDDKLSKISNFLLNVPSQVNLSSNDDWNGQEFRLVVYGGNEPFPLGRARNQQSWNKVVSELNTTIVNPTKLDGHQMTDALRFVFNNYRPAYGTAGNIIVVGDGFDFDEMESATTISTALKYQYRFSLGFLLMTTSQVQRSVVQPLASDFSHFYPIDSVDYLSNPAVVQTQANWICSAFYPVPAPPTPPPTRLPLLTTATTAGPLTQTTANPLLPPISSCTQNVLFLIDQSQTLLVNGYNKGYTSLSQFISSISNAPQTLGNSDAKVNNLDNSVANVQNVTKSIRSRLQTEIIGIDLRETVSNKKNVQNIIQFDVLDGLPESIYVGVSQPDAILDDQIINSTSYKLRCKGSSNCFTGITFVMETSQAEGYNYVDVQKLSIINVLNHYTAPVSVSLVYFSSPDSLDPNNPDRSGILFGQITNSTNAINILNTTNFDLGAASDLELGFTKTLESLNKGYLENNNLVIFFARGAYERLSNCCPDPTAAANAVKQQATVQGVMIGPYSSKSQLDSLTGSNSIDANALIGGNTLNSTQDRLDAADQISDAIIPIIDSFLNNEVCSGIPGYADPPCEDPIDVLVLLHANSLENWNRIKNFTANELLPSLLGETGAVANKQLTTSTPVNFAVASYYYLDVVDHADFTYLLSVEDYQNLLTKISYRETKGTATLSTAYKKAIEIFEDGRPYASKNLILITDTLDISDLEDAFSEHDAMTQLVGGYTTALAINTDIIPGADYQINIDPSQLDSYNRYTRRKLANSLTQNNCVYKPVQVPTLPPVTPSPTLPGPIPLVKARNVWPDITILIDTSKSQENPMNDELFEKIRAFLDILLIQYSVGKHGSRFTVATYDGDTVEYSCIFDQDSYYDLSSCRNERLSLFSRNHENYRNVDGVLSDVLHNVYQNNTSGYRSLNENFLVLFTLGASSTPFTQQLKNIERKGIRTIAIGLSNNISNNDLSQFSRTAFSVPDWSSSFSGIDTNYDLADRIFQITTKKRLPSSSNFFGNLVFIVDQSGNSASDHSNIVQYVTDFVTPYLIDPVKTQISIVPFAGSVISPLSINSSQTEVDSWLDSWKLTTASSDYSANVGSAIQFAASELGSTYDRPTHVVFVLGSANVTGTELAQQLLNGSNLYVASYNIANNTDFNNLVFTSDRIYSVNSSVELLNRVVSLDVTKPNPMLVLDKDILETQEKNDQSSFPTSSIAADVIMLLDETGLEDNEFETMKQFLSNFTQKFSVGSESTQFALQSYNGRTIPHDGFHLYESTSGEVVKNRIQQLTLAKAAENSTDADLAGAIEQEIFFFLTEKNGWREDTTTYTIIFSHADSFYTRDTDTAMGVKNVSSVFSLGVNGMKFDYVQNFTNTGFYETVAGVSALNINAPEVADLLAAINNDYKNLVYPSTHSVKEIVKADFIFLIDSSLGSSKNQAVQQFLLDFTANVGTFSSSGNDTRMAVVVYGKSATTLWNLQNAQDIDSLRNRISQIQITSSSSGTVNLRRAIDSIILNEGDFGVDYNRPEYIIDIASSLTISPTIDTATSRHLNTRYSTFVMQTNNDNSTFSYCSQVLGTKLFTDRVAINPELSFDNSEAQGKLFSWISNEFSAWSTTFPDKS